ncbi:MAG: MmcQ/YjbR family DNA-binding protein [Rikenellaceae bacterium]
MNIEEYREYCLSLPCVEESLPFDDVTLVYKIGGKLFTLATMESFDHFAVKCDPDEAIELRERYSAITPAFHLNKKHWNDIYVEQGLHDDFMRQQILNGYLLVARKSVTPKALRVELLEIIERELGLG